MLRRVVLSAAALSFACGSGSTSTEPPAPSFCASDPRVAAFSIGLQATPTAGNVHVRITAAEPARVVQGQNDWTVAISSNDAPIDGLPVTVKPQMPDHGHGSSTIPTVTALGGGLYRVSAITMPMRGVWTITFQVSGAIVGAATFTLCVDGT